MLIIRLSKAIKKRLNNLVHKIGRTKTYYVREAEDIEDTYLALQRLEKSAKRWTLNELEQNYDLEDCRSEQLATLENQYWITKAQEAHQEGFASTDAGEKLLNNLLNTKD